MLIEIDTNVLIEHNLTATQFILAYLLNIGDTKTLEQMYSSELHKDVDKLVELGFLHNGNELESKDSIDFSKLVLRTKFEEIIQTGDYFDEITSVYPTKVRRKDGTEDYLRTDLSRCRKAYAKITKNRKIKHDHILTCLKYEIEYRTDNNSLSYMQKLPKWLASEGWKVFEQMLLDKSNSTGKGELGYGQQLA
jgi:hypothetical protein